MQTNYKESETVLFITVDVLVKWLVRELAKKGNTHTHTHTHTHFSERPGYWKWQNESRSL